MSSRTGTVSARLASFGLRRALLTPLLGALLLVSLLFAAASVYLGEEVHESATLPTDQRVLHAIDNGTAAWPVAVGNDVSLLGTEVVLGVVGIGLIGWFSLRRRWLDALLLLGALGGYVVLTLAVKHLVNRERPVAFFRVPESGPSFPSGHTLGATCLALAFAFLLWHSNARRGLKALGSIALLLGVLLVALSRLMLGVHYPTDVLGSMLLGTAWMSALIALRFAAEGWVMARTPRMPGEQG
ncbi:MAG: phosphatase PAP2 family protein [Thermomicrobia bacterium]|nr:phosphatase PAP2 family protein [Thermomicrobia bacterium]MCA1724668.1 phosphatase PAP2 family protein [Thermomicrobia bacterium]